MQHVCVQTIRTQIHTLANKTKTKALVHCNGWLESYRSLNRQEEQAGDGTEEAGEEKKNIQTEKNKTVASVCVFQVLGSNMNIGLIVLDAHMPPSIHEPTYVASRSIVWRMPQ